MNVQSKAFALAVLLTSALSSQLALADDSVIFRDAFERIPVTDEVLDGIISTDRSLSGAFLVPSSLSIAAGTTVTIKPGSIIRLAYDAKIIVEGNLVAKGTSNLPVFFTCAEQCPEDFQNNNPWSGIELFNSQGNVFDTVVIEGARTALTLSGTSILNLTNSLIRHNYGVVFDPGGYQPVSVSNNTFLKNLSTFQFRLNGDSTIVENEFREIQGPIFERNSFYFDSTIIRGNNFIGALG